MSVNSIIIEDINFNYENIVYDFPIKYKNSFISEIKYKIDNKKKNFILKGPSMKFLKPKKDIETNIYLEFNNNNWNFYNLLQNIDNNIIKLIVKKSKTWFGNSMPINIVDEFYKTTINLQKNNNPRLKVKINNEEYLDSKYHDKKVIPYFKLKHIKFLSVECFLEIELDSLSLDEINLENENININNNNLNIEKINTKDINNLEILENINNNLNEISDLNIINKENDLSNFEINENINSNDIEIENNNNKIENTINIEHEKCINNNSDLSELQLNDDLEFILPSDNEIINFRKKNYYKKINKYTKDLIDISQKISKYRNKIDSNIYFDSDSDIEN